MENKVKGKEWSSNGESSQKNALFPLTDYLAEQAKVACLVISVEYVRDSKHKTT